jgi:signal transduction histidine kinase
VIAEQDRLAAVIEHVVQNAQEATADDGKVELRLTSDSQNAVIEIEDNGCGMDEKFMRERLFRPFDTTKGNAGMGIGAYECREFVRGLGGDVDVSSQPGIGTLFRLSIPRVQNQQ